MNKTQTSEPQSKIRSLEQRALSLRRHVLRMAERVGQGYVTRLGNRRLVGGSISAMKRRQNLKWLDRDRFFFHWTLLD